MNCCLTLINTSFLRMSCTTKLRLWAESRDVGFLLYTTATFPVIWYIFEPLTVAQKKPPDIRLVTLTILSTYIYISSVLKTPSRKSTVEHLKPQTNSKLYHKSTVYSQIIQKCSMWTFKHSTSYTLQFGKCSIHIAPTCVSVGTKKT